MHPLILTAWALAIALVTRWFLRRTTLRLWEWVAAFLLSAVITRAGFYAITSARTAIRPI
jgi:hypothetical protein